MELLKYTGEQMADENATQATRQTRKATKRRGRPKGSKNRSSAEVVIPRTRKLEGVAFPMLSRIVYTPVRSGVLLLRTSKNEVAVFDIMQSDIPNVKLVPDLEVTLAHMSPFSGQVK